MKKFASTLVTVAIFALVFFTFGACRSLTSLTTIPANDSFMLGNNPHNAYSVTLRNESRKTITIYQLSLSGEVKGTILAEPQKWLSVTVPANTALQIKNKADVAANVALKVYGDTNLSMGYKK